METKFLIYAHILGATFGAHGVGEGRSHQCPLGTPGPSIQGLPATQQPPGDPYDNESLFLSRRAGGHSASLPPTSETPQPAISLPSHRRTRRPLSTPGSELVFPAHTCHLHLLHPRLPKAKGCSTHLQCYLWQTGSTQLMMRCVQHSQQKEHSREPGRPYIIHRAMSLPAAQKTPLRLTFLLCTQGGNT